ncbi:MAG TPA: DHA2 family efflux MFS transporter permease subunit [Thermoanaerobaculia bacterium]|nr:DHA2 family efflux MFS transporter permease subunit [Thermoanaerobaculia bacterium]
MRCSPFDPPAVASRDQLATAPEIAEPSPWILVATILGSGMVFVDGTVVNVALPALQRDLGATVADVQWVVEAYAVLLAALLLVGGALGDRFGRRRLFACGVAAFALASAGCGRAPAIGWLIAWRAIQGAAAALLVPGSLAILAAAYPPRRRGRAIGTWSGATGITAAIGPLLGGWLIDHASWRWVFFLNLPLAAAVLLATWWRVPESRDPQSVPGLDWAGAALATLGLAGVTFGLIELPRLGAGHPAVAAALAGGGLALAGFMAVEARGRHPMMPLSLFRSRVFAGANLLTLFLYAGLGGALFFLPFNLIQVQHYSATAAGAALLPLILIMFLLSRWAGGFAERRGARLPLTIGPAIAAVGFALFALPGQGGSYWTTYFPAVVVLGLGMVTSVAPLTTTVMGAVEVRHAGLASGINNAVSRVAGLLAVATLGIVVAAAFGRGLDRRLQRLDLPAASRRALAAEAAKMTAAAPPPGLTADQAARVQQALAASFLDGFRLAMLSAAALALAAAASGRLTLGRE